MSPWIHLFRTSIFVVIFCLLLSQTEKCHASRAGYYRYPAIHGQTIIFASEGDLWAVSTSGGDARRLTSALGRERYASLSYDGTLVAFTAEYDGRQDVYTMPIEGGVPQRRTWDGDAIASGWTRDGRLLISTERYSGLSDRELVAITASGDYEVLPLAQASQGVYSTDGRTLYFTREARQPSNTKRYKGGMAQHIWRYDGGSEATNLTGDWAGTSSNPMLWEGRLYFLSDRSGVMNVYSMNFDGKDLQQHTHHRGFDIQSASLSEGQIAYECGGDIWLLDLKTGRDHVVPITLVSDFDQLREQRVEAPLEYLSSAHISPDGTAVVFTTRGEVFSVPVAPGRIVKVAGKSGVRFRDAKFLPDGKNILVLSTQTGETEFWKYPATGVGTGEQWTSGANVLRWDGIPSPDGRWIAHYDKNQRLWLLDTHTRMEKFVTQSTVASIPSLKMGAADFANLTWSPDSQWLAYVDSAPNTFRQIEILNAASGEIHKITSNRYNSVSPVWSSDGNWLYFLSDRNVKSAGYTPFRLEQPDASFTRLMKIYELPLVPGLRSPFLPANELDGRQPEESENLQPKDTKNAFVKIDFTGIENRLNEVPVQAGNYSELQGAQKRLCWLSRDDGIEERRSLRCTPIGGGLSVPDNVVDDLEDYEVSLDRRRMLVQKGRDFYILGSDAGPEALATSKALAKAKIDLTGWSFFVEPRSEFHQLFDDAWRLERDYFYDPSMHGVDWDRIRERYQPLVDRVSDRYELNDVIAQMCAELSALHIFVGGGDVRKPADSVNLASLGAFLRRDEKAGGLVVEHIYAHDPDRPDQAPPLARPESLVLEGQIITSIDGEKALGAPDERALLRGKSGQKVLLQLKSPNNSEVRSLLVTPVSEDEDGDMRYNEWAYTRRKRVEADSHEQIGYIHLRGMGREDIEKWALEFYPIYDRTGLIIDVRHNGGGNIDSWLLEKLLRRAWFYWQPRTGGTFWNMPYAFRGHVVVLCDQYTLSNAEDFAEGFRRLALGKVIGARTWGGAVWMHGNNRVSDGGIATAGEVGIYGPEGKWLIEGRGVEPDIAVDNLPHATFGGADAQLEEALRVLKEAIKEDPRPVPKPPPYPNKAFKE